VEAYAVTGAEPPKPEQTFHLAEGVDEFQPSRATLDDALSLRTILDSLDEMKEDLDQKEAKLLVATFNWFAYEGMILDPTRHRNLYIYLNRVYWPITYANMRRMADFQNRVFRMWAAENQVGLVDVAAQTPHQPDLFDDAIHDTPLGIRIRGWITFEYLVPVLKQRLEAGELPQHDRIFLKEHPYITSEYKMISLEQN
jgi:hypothetical protein